MRTASSGWPGAASELLAYGSTTVPLTSAVRRWPSGGGRRCTSSRSGMPAGSKPAGWSELRLDAEEIRMEAALRAGRHREVLAEAQARAAEAPLRERRWALLALAQYQAGRQGDALRTLHQARETLVAELGIDPAPSWWRWRTRSSARIPPSSIAAPCPSLAVCPYLGLVPYDVADSEGFFGREREVEACLGRLATVGVLLVVGPSGSGKSSLVRAGVAAALQRNGRRVVVITPGTRPMDALIGLRVGSGAGPGGRPVRGSGHPVRRLGCAGGVLHRPRRHAERGAIGRRPASRPARRAVGLSRLRPAGRARAASAWAP